MSKRYPGGVITKSPATPTGPFQTGAAPGIWTLDQQLQYQQQGVWPTAGLSPNYIEDVFSTWLYTGTGAAITVNNGIDLSGKGGLVWVKPRNTVDNHYLYDTVRGVNSGLESNTTSAAANYGVLSSFNSNGFTDNYLWSSTDNLASWTFRKQPKFFDVVTYTGNGVNGRAIAHNLGSVPGCMIVKSTSDASDWPVYHRSYAVPTNRVQYLNNTGGVATGPYWPTAPTSTNFYVAGDGYDNNTTGQTYVAYLFAHDAGGFGLTGTDNVISCGSFTTDGSGNATINLGYEPQWILFKSISAGQNWTLGDVMRGWNANSTTNMQIGLRANSSRAENATLNTAAQVTATGFNATANNVSDTFIYIAIRRGPMKVPTDATKVYQANTYTGNATANTTVAGNFGFPVDLMLLSSRSANATNWSSYGQMAFDRLRGNSNLLATASTTAASFDWTTYNSFAVQNSIGWGLYGADSGTDYLNNSGGTWVARGFQRAPGFFDEVCYTGTGVATTQTHNLTVVPELMIVKRRNDIRYWAVYAAPLGATKWLELETQDAVQTATMWNNTTPTSSVFSIGTFNGVNGSGDTYVAYLFATCAGVSKVGSYTGNGTTQTIDCGFTSGARFVLIKRTDATGGWYTYDTARGMTVLTDPYLLLNSTAAEVATLGSVTTVSTGFALNSTILAAINVSGGTYIFLAIS